MLSAIGIEQLITFESHLRHQEVETIVTDL